MLAAYNCMRFRIEILPGDGVQPERALGFFYRDSVKLYPCFPDSLTSLAVQLCAQQEFTMSSSEVLLEKVSVCARCRLCAPPLAIRKSLRNARDVNCNRSIIIIID